MSTAEPGVFTISIDTELAWGSFDSAGVSSRADAFESADAVVERLCGLFEEYGVSATWAVVGHLLRDCGGTDDCRDRTKPGIPWVDDWYSELPCATGVDRDLWYAPELVATIEDCGMDQEVALHGDTHLIFDESTRAAADEELRVGVETLRDAGFSPESFVFPRNKVDHVDLLGDHGITSYRGRDARWYEDRRVPAQVRKPLRFVDEVAERTPPTVVPAEHDGAINIPGSHVFRPDHGGWQWTRTGSQARRARKGLEAAATEGSVYHLWFHPFNLAREMDSLLVQFRKILQHAAQLRDEGRLEVLPMKEVARHYRNGRWNDE